LQLKQLVNLRNFHGTSIEAYFMNFTSKKLLRSPSSSKSCGVQIVTPFHGNFVKILLALDLDSRINCTRTRRGLGLYGFEPKKTADLFLKWTTDWKLSSEWSEVF
jgi:hypothetical protein